MESINVNPQLLLLACLILFIIFKIDYFLKDFIYLFLEKGEEREKERKRNIDVRENIDVRDRQRWVVSCTCANWERNPQPRHAPDQESNRQPFSLRDVTQPTEPLRSRLVLSILNDLQNFVSLKKNPKKFIALERSLLTMLLKLLEGFRPWVMHSNTISPHAR